MRGNQRRYATQRASQAQVEAAFAAMVPWARKHFGLTNEWQPNLRTFYDPKINMSKGGWFAVPDRVNRTRKHVLAISINLCHHRFPEGEFWEYPHYQMDPKIGKFWGSWQKQLWAVVAHELAHAVEYADVDPRMIDQAASAARREWLVLERGNHMARFQWVYMEFRMRWINGDAWQMPEEPPLAAKPMISELASAPPVIRVFNGAWAHGGFAMGRFETVGAFTGGFRVKTSQGTRDLLVEAPNWVAV